MIFHAMKQIKYLLFLLPVVLTVWTACDQEMDPNYIIDDVLQPTDTLTYTDYYAEAMSEWIDKNRLPDSADVFSPLGLCVTGDTLYVANWSARTIEVFDARTLEYRHTIVDKSNAQQLNSRNVYVSDSLLFIPGINPSQVSVYNRFSEKYLCRLGNGSWQGALVHANSVAADSHFVYVRDQSAEIKVFTRANIQKAVESGNLQVNTSFKMPIAEVAWNGSNYSMLALGGKLFAANNPDKTLYVYTCNPEDNSYTVEKYTFSDGSVPYGIAASDQYVFISTQGASAAIQGYDRAAFLSNPQLDSPLFSLSYSQIVGMDTALEAVHFMTVSGDRIFVRQSDKILPLQLKEQEFDIIDPRLKHRGR